MHSEYDENLRENLFFMEMRENQPDLMKKVAEESWILCVPRSGTIEKNEINIDTILDQILIPHDDGLLKGYRTCSTLSKKRLQIRKNQIIIDNCHFFSDTVGILFKETFYEGHENKYTVWCIDRPLCLEQPLCALDHIQVLESLPDCIDFLWVESMSQDVLQQVQNLCVKFIESTPNYELEHIQNQKDLIGSLYSRCLQKALRNNNIRTKMAGNDQFLEKLKLAVETYMQHCLGKKIMFGITTFFAQNDTHVNKIIQCSQDLSDKNLGISSGCSDAMLCAKFELSKLNNSVTILDKVNCLDRTFVSLCGNKNSDQYLTSDNLLQMFVALILKVNVHNWISNLNFIQDFKFCSSTFTDHVNFLLTTLEAAIEFIKGNNFSNFCDDKHHTEIEVYRFIKKGDLPYLKRLFENSEDVDFREKLCHPLCLCDKCAAFTKSILLDKEIRNEKDQSLLIYATIYERIEIVEYLLSTGVNVNSQDGFGKTALHYASEKGFQDIILLLVSNDNINVNVQDNNGDTPLHLATGIAHEPCVKALIYSSPDLNTNMPNNYHQTPLHLAAKLGYLSIVRILLENSSSELSDTQLHSILSNCHNLSIKNMIQQFSIKKVIPSFAFGKNESEFEDYESAKAIFGIKPRTEDDQKKVSLLINAIKNNDLPLTCFYLGFDHTELEDVSPVKCHPLCDCEKCRNNASEKFEKSLDTDNNISNNESRAEVNVNMCNSDGYTALHIASQYGRCSILRVLLDCGAQINLQTYKTYFTPLHLACLFQQISIVKELLKCCNCDVNIRDYLGNTPLFYACTKNDSRIIEILLKNDADYDVKNKNGNTVWDVCQKKMHYRAFKALKTTAHDSRNGSNENLGL